MLALYAVWNYAGRQSIVHIKEAFANGRSVWDVERFLHLPSEVDLEHTLMPYRTVMRALNVYYAGAHVPTVIACLVFVFVLHRSSYPSLRTTLAITTGACLLVQLIPVTPPRMYPGLGFVDAGAVFGPSVYGKVGTGIADQLSAMPSVHVAWAAWVALAVIVAGTSRWRYWILAHPLAHRPGRDRDCEPLVARRRGCGGDPLRGLGASTTRPVPRSLASGCAWRRPPPAFEPSPPGVPTPVEV